jgi:ribonuclease HI
MMVFVARQIWLWRNDVVFNEEFRPLEEFIQATRTQMEQHDQAMAQWTAVDHPMGNTSNRTHVRWMKPPIGVIKINWDAALEEQIGTVGLGAIAQDHEGRVLAMQCSTGKHIDTPTKAEMLVAWNAVILGVQLGVTYLELEGDAMEVVQGINSTRHCLGREGPVLNDIKTLLQNFNTWKVTHVNRGRMGLRIV